MMMAFILVSSALGTLQKLAHTVRGALLPVIELVASLLCVGSLMATFITILHFEAAVDMSYTITTLNTITGYGVSGWFDAFFGKIRMLNKEATAFESEFVVVVIRYLTPILLYLLYSRLTITTILLSFRRAKKQLNESYENTSDDEGWGLCFTLKVLFLGFNAPSLRLGDFSARSQSLDDGNYQALLSQYENSIFSSRIRRRQGGTPPNRKGVLQLIMAPYLRHYVQDFSSGVDRCKNPSR
jgi:hypothetical protein